MKRIVAVLSNHHLVVESGDKQRIVPAVEVVLVLGNTDYQLEGPNLDLVSKPVTEVHRFEADAGTLERTAQSLLEMAKWCREFKGKVHGQGEEERSDGGAK